MTHRFPIGTTFTPRGKVKRLHTVVDCLTTTNAKGEVVKMTYIAEHEFMGQTVTSEVIDTTIALGSPQSPANAAV